ncbi:hypothetical protein MY004_08000 [Escherichia coli]|nr:hypothetical protein MY004_08000 [Escherichia coli]
MKTIRGVGLITLMCGVSTLIPQYLVAVNLGAELPAFAGSLGKRKLTAVCSHQTRIGNLDAHLI